VPGGFLARELVWPGIAIDVVVSLVRGEDSTRHWEQPQPEEFAAKNKQETGKGAFDWREVGTF
jgi:hypothetical protein